MRGGHRAATVGLSAIGRRGPRSRRLRPRLERRGQGAVLGERRTVPCRELGGHRKGLHPDWYRRLAAARLPEDAARWARRLGVEPPRVIVSEQEKRWGTCSKGVVRLNWRIVQAPKSLIDYVVAHEVTHLLHEDHSRAFWAALGRVMPDYEVRKGRLREMGPGLVW